VLLVHGIGSQRPGDTVVHVGRSIHRWLCDFLKHLDVEVVDATLARQAAPAEPPHARIVFRQRTRRSPYTWILAESHWADCFPPPTYGEFARWAVSVVPMAVLQHLTAQFLPALESLKAKGPWVGIRQFFELVPYEVPRLRRRLLDDPGARFQPLRAWTMLTAYQVVLLLPVFMVGALVIQVALFAILVPAFFLRFGFVQSFARWIQLALSASIGDSYLFTANPIVESAIVTRVQRDIEWLAVRCDEVVVVAHSQGAAIAYEAIQQWTWRECVPKPLKRLITYGSGLRKLFELKSALRRSAWAEPSQWTFFVVVALLLSGALALLLVLLFVGQVSVLGALAGGIVVYLFLLGLMMAAAENLKRRPTLLPVTWDDLYASHDPVSSGPICVEAGETPPPRGPLDESGDPVLAFYLRQRDVVNRCSAVGDHTSYWSGLDDFVARVVTRLLAVSSIQVHSLTPDWLDVAGDRRQWRVRFLSGCRAVAAIAAITVFLSTSQSSGFLAEIGRSTKEFARESPGWVNSGPIQVVAAAAADALVGATAVGLAVGLCVYLLYAFGRLGWTMWERQELNQFFFMMGYAPRVVGPTVLGLAWLALIGFPHVASAFLRRAALDTPFSPWWTSALLAGLSAALLWRVRMPPGTVRAWVARALADGEAIFAAAAGDPEKLADAKHRFKMGAVLLTDRRDLAARVRALQAFATCMERLDVTDVREWQLLADTTGKAIKALERAGQETSALRAALDKAMSRIAQLQSAATNQNR
jgi:hypothetical protein